MKFHPLSSLSEEDFAEREAKIESEELAVKTNVMR